MIIEFMLRSGLFFAALSLGLLLLIMVVFDPRVWAYSDYPQEIKAKIPAQTRHERRLSILVSLPWLLFILSYPIYSTLQLKAVLGGEISVGLAFLNLLWLFLLVSLGDLLILDYLIISKLTPDFVMIDGTEKEDYQDFTYHYIGHAKVAFVIIPVLLGIAIMISRI